MNLLQTRRIVKCAIALLIAMSIQPAVVSIGEAQAISTSDPLTYSYPISTPGQPPGVGFYIRHGYAVENTWYLPGYWHTGEDWYAREGDTAGAAISAVADGEVVFAGSDYPGRVVIIAHEDGLFSMYGHLDYALNVTEGDSVRRGDLVGIVLDRADDVPSHLHFEMRTFVTTPEVNGDSPRYGFQCGPDCAPGPGYWPIEAPEHPSAMGWLNPTHVINKRAFGEETAGTFGTVVVGPDPLETEVEVWSAPDGEMDARQTDSLTLVSGATFPLRDVYTAPEDTSVSSAESYEVWYEIELANDMSGWVRVVLPWDVETGSDGRSSSVRLLLLVETDLGGG